MKQNLYLNNFIFVENNMYAWEGLMFQKKLNKQLSHALKLFNNKNKSQAPITTEI